MTHLYDSRIALAFRREGEEVLFLILHDPWENLWDLSGGQVDADDLDDEATVRREVFEETGIGDLHFVEGFRWEREFHIKSKGGIKHLVVYLCETSQSEVVTENDPDEQYDAYHWIRVQDLKESAELRRWPGGVRNWVRGVIKEAASFLEGA